jgi:SecD/SecF fusion protein
MQNKGAIRLFAIVLALVCLYQLSFTYFSKKTEREAREISMGDRNRERAYLDSISDQVVFNFLWLRKYTYMECKEKEINLGLDLKGGMNVVLEVSVEDIIKSKVASRYLLDPVFTGSMEIARIKRQTSQADFVDLFAESFQEVKPGEQLAQYFMTTETRGVIDLNTTNEQVVDFLKTEAEGAIDNAFNVLRNRIDRFGVVQPNIQRLERQGRILVELPGVDDPERVTKLLTGTANLEFWTTYENAEVVGFLQEANGVLSTVLYGEDELLAGSTDPSPVGTAADTAAQTGEISLFDAQKDSAAGIDLFGKTDTTSLGLDEERARRENPLFAVLTPYVDQNMQPVPGSVIGVVHLKDTALVNRYLSTPQVRNILTDDLKQIRFVWNHKPMKESPAFVQLHAIKATPQGGPSLTGKYVNNARMAYGQFASEAEVHMSMNAEGATRWKNLTRENVNRCIAIVLDGYVVSAPVVRGEIPGGSSTISGNFDQAEATDLANILKSGKMPARARVESSEVIGPSLGQASINAGLNSFLIAFVVVLLYMLFYYSRRGGMVADIALVVNMFFLIGVLASLQAVLTLPGIAGIVLTIGMSVDANVLIYERIRDELRAGKGLKLAIADGYKNAYSAIIDGNVTTLLTGVILYLFGTGPIKGFATTLVIGILTSLFSAIFITRLVYERQLDKNRKLTFSTRLTENAFKNVNINFLGRRKFFYVVSVILVGISAAGLLTRGLNLGVDFSGGRNFVVEFPQTVALSDVRSALQTEFGQMPTVITFGEENRVRITTKFMIDSESADTDSIIKAKMYSGLKPYLAGNASLQEFVDTDVYIKSAQKVGPTIADDIKVQAVWAILFSLIVIFIYIIIRFRNWQYGLGAVVSLVHDVTITLGMFALFHDVLPFSLEIDQAFIAAILTVVGYSINDTVIVFDRIREYRKIFHKRDNMETMNTAINSTLSRTINTSLTTLVVILTIFIFGGEVIRGFTFALLVGIGIGTYSSVFVASPVAYDAFGKKGKADLEKTKS